MIRLELSVPASWENVKRVRERVSEALVSAPEELRVASAMVASELLENAIKHGIPDVSAHFLLEYSEHIIRIRVGNTPRSEDAVREANDRIEQLSDSPDKQKLYLSRFATLSTDPSASGKLGLYRIGLEGAFALSCTSDGPTFWVTAVRSTQ